ncbi:unnamed protein product [Strongylus vulgaris]|uniref:Peptidase M14 domain-containing protein n=1 Tax=Strongylus vulgaris TaxID=40348 RepID=A0A3P7JCR8_STRVU|nr:unnamed protein product [Strongylus vulgaris]
MKKRTTRPLSQRRTARRAINRLHRQYGTEYRMGTGADTLSPASGGSDDWAKANGIKYVYLVELRPEYELSNGFILHKKELIPTAVETFEGVKVGEIQFGSYALHFIINALEVIEAVLEHNKIRRDPLSRIAPQLHRMHLLGIANGLKTTIAAGSKMTTNLVPETATQETTTTRRSELNFLRELRDLRENLRSVNLALGTTTTTEAPPPLSTTEQMIIPTRVGAAGLVKLYIPTLYTREWLATVGLGHAHCPANSEKFWLTLPLPPTPLTVVNFYYRARPWLTYKPRERQSSRSTKWRHFFKYTTPTSGAAVSVKLYASTLYTREWLGWPRLLPRPL